MCYINDSLNSDRPFVVNIYARYYDFGKQFLPLFHYSLKVCLYEIT